MDYILEKTIELCKEMQKDARFVAFEKAKNDNDNDKELQDLIGDFNMKRIQLNTEMSKAEKDQKKIDEYNNELRELYQKVMTNKSMVAFNEIKGEIDALINHISAIVNMTVNGEDPAGYDPEAASCTGSCSTCGGCH